MKYSLEFSNFLHTTNPWWDNADFRFTVKERPDYLRALTVKNRLICSLIGARRVGKTSILFSLINYLLERGVQPQKIIYLNSDLREIQELGIRNTLEHIAGDFKIDFVDDQLIVLIDEIQELQD